jgi:two-component system OmpR family response regulator
MLNQIFSSSGFSVVTTENGQDALTAAQKEAPDLILLDIQMPKMDGIAVAKALRDSGNKTPVIFLTNFKDETHISQAMEMGMPDYIVKSDMHIDDVVARVKSKLGMA